ncbi:hypothetical protein EB74_24410 [Mycobacterium sp. SWH-M5]|nr:hypothetical protein EB74_24410 [Mycobacterium sp. SWH-M5]
MQALLTSDSDRGTAARFYQRLDAARTNNCTGRLRIAVAVVTCFDMDFWGDIRAAVRTRVGTVARG